MDEAESPRKSFWTRKRTIAVLVASIFAGGFLLCGFLYGFGSFAKTWQEVKSLAVKTLHDVLGSGSGAQFAAEIDLADPVASSSAPEQEVSSVDTFMDNGAASMDKVYSVAKNPPSVSSVKKEINTFSASAEKHNTTGSIPSAAPLAEGSFSASGAEAAGSISKSNTINPNCDFTLTNESSSQSRVETGPTHQVLFNEIAWMGSLPQAGETSAQAGNKEWIELRDNNGATVDLSGWQILNQSEKLKVVFDDGAHIDFGEFLLLERGDDNAVPSISADKIYSGTLSNSGEWLRLFDRNCHLIDEINASGGWPGGNNSTKATLERDLMDPDWHMSGYPGGTPKAANSVVWKAPLTPQPLPVAVAAYPPLLFGDGNYSDSSTTPASSSAGSASATSTDASGTTSSISDQLPPSLAPMHLVIAAVQIAGASSTNDFIKIFNPTSGAIDISGWKLRKRTSSGAEYSIRVLLSGSTVQSQNYFTWANSANNFASSIAANVSSSETLAADNSVALDDASGTIIDALAWGSGQTTPFIEGAAYPTNPIANQILLRKFSDGIVQDTDNNAQDFEVR